MSADESLTRLPGRRDPADRPRGGGQALIRRIRFLAAMIVAGAIFWYVGWWVVHPRDPLGPVTIFMADQGVVAMAELLGLAIAASGLAVAICGDGAAERGPLAVAVGLAALGLRGGTMDTLVLSRLARPDAITDADPFPVTALIAETWLWLALIAVGFVVGRWVGGWFDGHSEPQTAGEAADHSADIRHGIGSMVTCSAAAYVLVDICMGEPEAPLLKGQIAFAVIASFLVGGMLAHFFFTAPSPVWSLVSVALVATVAYVRGQPGSSMLIAAHDRGTYLTLAPVIRALPIEFAALGAIGALVKEDAISLFRALFGLDQAPRLGSVDSEA